MGMTNFRLNEIAGRAFHECEDRGACCISDWADAAFALDNNDPAKIEAMARLAGAALWYAESLQHDADMMEQSIASGEEWPEP